MTRQIRTAWLAAACVVLAAPVYAQVRDADYRGTLVCEKLPFAQDTQRAAIVVKIAGSQGSYERTVYAARSKPAGKETGTAKVDGEKISLSGGWKDEKESYEASYTGSFVRRRAKIAGTQKWTRDGKSYTRQCSGSISRPLAAFLPKQKKQ